MQLFTLGYEGLNLDQFFSILRAHDIEYLIDVRQMPLSRKKGFSKKALDAAATQQSIEYLHWQTLGCPRPIRDQYREDGNWRNYVRDFSHYVKTQDEVIDDLIALANQRRCCLLCFEADALFCHRSLVAQRACDNGGLFEIVNLTAASVDRQLVLV